MKALPAIAMSVGALITVGAPGLAVWRHVQARSAGLAGQAAAADSDVAVFALFGMFAMPFGLLLMIGGYLVRRSRIKQERVTAARRAREKAARDARLSHAPDWHHAERSTHGRPLRRS
jgi:hypothetical protein